LETSLVVLFGSQAASGVAKIEISSVVIRAELMPPVEKSGGYMSKTNVVVRKRAATSERAGACTASKDIASHTALPMVHSTRLAQLCRSQA
jgi:hypothetical protein